MARRVRAASGWSKCGVGCGVGRGASREVRDIPRVLVGTPALYVASFLGGGLSQRQGHVCVPLSVRPRQRGLSLFVLDGHVRSVIQQEPDDCEMSIVCGGNDGGPASAILGDDV